MNWRRELSLLFLLGLALYGGARAAAQTFPSALPTTNPHGGGTGSTIPAPPPLLSPVGLANPAAGLAVGAPATGAIVDGYQSPAPVVGQFGGISDISGNPVGVMAPFNPGTPLVPAGGEDLAENGWLEMVPGVKLFERLFPAYYGGPTGYYDPFSTQFTYGNAGVQPYQFGWFSYDDFVYVPQSNASIGGKFMDLEWNFWQRYAMPFRDNSLVYAATFTFNGKWWDSSGNVNLPPDMTQIAGDFQLSSSNPGPWNWQVGVTPQFNRDFRHGSTSQSFFVDGRAALLYKRSPNLTLAAGFEYWDRETQHVIPYGGVIWAPTDRLEFRMLFPKARISWYAGNFRGFDTWAYTKAEYNIDAYQVNIPYSDVLEIRDYRVLAGCNFFRGHLNIFAEGGAMFRRQFRFRGPTADFDLGDSLMLRTGFTY